MGRIGSPPACSRIGSKPARSPLKNVNMFSSSRQQKCCRELERRGRGSGVAAAPRSSGERFGMRGSAVEVLRAIPSSNKRDSRLVVIPAVFVSGCQADALGFPITDRNLVAWSAATRLWYEIYY